MTAGDACPSAAASSKTRFYDAKNPSELGLIGSCHFVRVLGETIPLRPELVEFMSPRSLCRYACASKKLYRDVRDTKAWELLARAQLPRAMRNASSDALSRVRSHVRRRLLADALSQEKPPPQTFRPNRFEDFTYFVRFEEEGRLNWEGDLRSQTDRWGGFAFL